MATEGTTIPEAKMKEADLETPAYKQTTIVEDNGKMGYDGGITGEKRFQLDTEYTKTLPGMVKIIQLCVGFVCFISILAGGPSNYQWVGFCIFVTLGGFAVTTTLLIMYLFHVIDSMPAIPWTISEMAFCFAWTLFYFIAACVLGASAAQNVAGRGWFVSAFIGFAAMISYGFDCFLKFRAWKAEGGTAPGPHIRQMGV